MRILSALGRGLTGFPKQAVLGLYNLGLWLIIRIPYFGPKLARQRAFFKRLQKRGKRGRLYWVNVAATVCLITIIGGALLAGGVFIAFSKDLPSPDRLIEREISLSTKIYDRNGELLYDIYGDVNRTLVTLDQVPEVVKQATIAIEDKHFYQHRGFDPAGIARAVYKTVVHRSLQGGSTITQQLIKNVLLTRERTLTRKVKEFILALQIEARFSKDEILQMYLNESPYGGQAIGIEAAAQSYFGKSVSKLSLTEAAMLAGLPAAPSRFSPRRNPELAEWRQAQVLRRMAEDGYITWEEAEEAGEVELKYVSEAAQIRAPHFVMYVRELLADRYGEALVEHGGLRVTTTLDLKLHNKFQKIVTEKIKQDRIYKVSNGALAALNPKTGEILSMVGSVDYFNKKIKGKFNVVLAERQPGSAIKPITYVTAFKQGYSPATTLIDIPTSFNIGYGRTYRPADFANIYHGILPIRKTLGSSKNVPAVKMLSLVGIENMIATAHDIGITTLSDPARYGLSVTLGGGEVKLLDLTAAFTCFATGGIRHDPVAILKVTDHRGNILEEFKENSGVRVLTQQQAYLINHILSDFNARILTFGGGSQLGLHIPGHTAAIKTGTTHDNRDGWAVGYTPAHKDSKAAIAIGVWIGNSDNSEMSPTYFAGAARIWNKAMITYLGNKPDVKFVRPKGIVGGTVDAFSGKAPGPFTTSKRSDIFIAGTVPTEPDDWHKELEICTPDGKLASDACRWAGKSKKKVYIKVTAKRPEWQDDVDAWVKKAYPKNKYPQYYPPTQVSTLCFDSERNVVDCAKSNPFVDVTLDPDQKDNLPTSFEVRAQVTTQPGRTIAFVEIYLADTSFGSGQLTTANCGDYCYSYKFESVPSGDYELRVYAEDTAGGATTKTIPITVGSTEGENEGENEGDAGEGNGDGDEGDGNEEI